MSGTDPARPAYHHGDLRTALIEAALELTRSGGPGALTLREATRRAGVSPSAAYRHFGDRNALVGAAATVIGDRMARRMRLRRSIDTGSASAAVDRLRAVGLGYIRFALAEPGWFTTAFFGADMEPVPVAGTLVEDEGVPTPYRMLVDALDGLVTAGALEAEQRPGAEWPCFSAVHGFAELALRGPLRHESRAALDRLAVRTVDVAIVGVLGPQY